MFGIKNSGNFVAAILLQSYLIYVSVIPYRISGVILENMMSEKKLDQSLANMVTSSFLKSARRTALNPDTLTKLSWFIPNTEVIKGRPHCQLFLLEWLNWGSEHHCFNSQWRDRVDYILDVSCCEANEENARVASTFFAWLGTSIGNSFLKGLLEKIKEIHPSSTNNDFQNRDLAISEWSKFVSINSFSSHQFGVRLVSILGKKDLTSLTYLEISIVQSIIVYLSYGEGLIFLEKVLKKSDRLKIK